MTSIRERRPDTAGVGVAGRRWLRELGIFVGLVALVIVVAIVVAVMRGGEEEPLVGIGGSQGSAVLNTEPWGEPDYGLLDEILNPITPAASAAAPGSPVFEIGGFAITEPWGEPDSDLLASVTDPVGAQFRAMEPVGEPDAALLAEFLDPVGAQFRAMEPTGRPDYERLYSIVGTPYAEQAAGPR